MSAPVCLPFVGPGPLAGPLSHVVHGLRSALTAVCVWLGLGSPLAPAQQVPADIEPTTAPTAIVSRAAVEALLRELDELFGAGDVAGYLARFQPDHAGSVAMLGRHLRRLREHAPRITRQTEILVDPRAIGPRTVVRLRHRVLGLGVMGHDGADQPFVEDSYLAVRADAAGRAIPTFAIEMEPAVECLRGDGFRCPACNYAVGGVDGWLCVPLRNERIAAIESASFFLIGTDIAVDVSVQVAPSPEPARVVATRLADALQQLDRSARIGLPEAWLPEPNRSAPPANLDGARICIDLPEDVEGRGARTCLHVVALGSLQHLLLVRGSRSGHERHADAIRRLLASYHLLQVDRDLAEAAAEPLRHHAGGVLDGVAYRNERYDVQINGPAGWRASQRVGGGAFRVLWQSPGGACLWLVGVPVPTGMLRWTEATADRWLAELCARHGLRPQPDAIGSADWDRADTCTADEVARQRTLVTTMRIDDPTPSAPGGERKRWIRLVLHDDLLLVLDGSAASPAEEAALKTAQGSLRSR